MAHLNIDAMCRPFGLKTTLGPYLGASPTVLAVVTGEVALTISTPLTALSFMEEGRLEAIAVGSGKRLGHLPSTPTMSELGIATHPLISDFLGLAAPSGTPSSILDRRNKEISKAAVQPDVAPGSRPAGLARRPAPKPR